jgi:hypothetical protein
MNQVVGSIPVSNLPKRRVDTQPAAGTETRKSNVYSTEM